MVYTTRPLKSHSMLPAQLSTTNSSVGYLPEEMFKAQTMVPRTYLFSPHPSALAVRWPPLPAFPPFPHLGYFSRTIYSLKDIRHLQL